MVLSVNSVRLQIGDNISLVCKGLQPGMAAQPIGYILVAILRKVASGTTAAKKQEAAAFLCVYGVGAKSKVVNIFIPAFSLYSYYLRYEHLYGTQHATKLSACFNYPYVTHQHPTIPPPQPYKTQTTSSFAPLQPHHKNFMPPDPHTPTKSLLCPPKYLQKPTWWLL